MSRYAPPYDFTGLTRADLKVLARVRRTVRRQARAMLPPGLTPIQQARLILTAEPRVEALWWQVLSGADAETGDA